MQYLLALSKVVVHAMVDLSQWMMSVIRRLFSDRGMAVVEFMKARFCSFSVIARLSDRKEPASHPRLNARHTRDFGCQPVPLIRHSSRMIEMRSATDTRTFLRHHGKVKMLCRRS